MTTKGNQYLEECWQQLGPVTYVPATVLMPCYLTFQGIELKNQTKTNQRKANIETTPSKQNQTQTKQTKHQTQP